MHRAAAAGSFDETRKPGVWGARSCLQGLTAVQREVRVLFGKLGFDFGFLLKQRKGELSWLPVPTEPPLLAAVRQPLLVQSARAPLCVCCSHATVSLSCLCDRDRNARGKFCLAKKCLQRLTCFVACTLVDRAYDAVIVTSLFHFLPYD